MYQFWVNRSNSTLAHSYPFLLSENSKNKKINDLSSCLPLAGITFKNVNYWGPIWGQNTLFPGHIPAKNKRLCLQKIFLLNFEVFHSKWMVAVEMVFDLSYCFYYLFKTERARKMQFLPLQRKIEIDVVPSKFEQNQLSKSWEIAQNVRGKKKARVMQRGDLG